MAGAKWLAYPLPPRTRGRRRAGADLGHAHASTPAHAGPAAATPCGRSCRDLYPRARGASDPVTAPRSRGGPLPPRTRGQRRPRPHPRRHRTSTPAHAGPARVPPGGGRGRGLYPRARGASGRRSSSRRSARPLPPRTRGQRDRVGAPPGSWASTPAHAGPAQAPVSGLAGGRLYPRARGASTRVPLKYYGTRYRALRLPFTASPSAPSGTSHTPSRTTGPATA